MSTLILGKDAPLEETLARLQARAADLHLKLRESAWLNPLPHLWSVHLDEETLPQVIYSNGKGASKLAALCSAYGELFERLSTHTFFADYYLGAENARASWVHFPDEKWTPLPDDAEEAELPSDVLNAALRRFYSEGQELTLDLLVDIGSSAPSRGVCSLPFTNARNGEVVYFPINLLDNLYGSNGMSSGNTKYEALVQALSEIIERYVKREIIVKGLALPQIPEEILQLYPECRDTLQGLQGPSLKVICCDASLGGRFPVICALLINQKNGTCAAAFGAHPMFQVALERTLTELMQGRSFADLDSFEEPTFDLDLTGDETNLESQFIDSTGLLPLQMLRGRPDFKFVHWDFAGSSQEAYRALRCLINKLGFEIYVRAYQGLGVEAYRVIVPGMSEVYPQDDLTYNNLSRAIDFTEDVLALPACTENKDYFAACLSAIEEADFVDEELIAPLIGLLPQAGSPWAQLRMGELKCLIALRAEDWETALQYARWTVSFNHDEFKLSRLTFYRCLIKALELKTDPALKADDLKAALTMLYGDKTPAAVADHLTGRAQFYGLTASDLSLTGFADHQRLIDIFTRLKEVEGAAAQQK